MDKKAKEIVDAYRVNFKLNDAITDKDTFGDVSEYVKYKGWTMLNFSVKQTKSLAFTKMIKLAMINGWVLDTLYVRDGLISGSFVR